MLGSGDRLSNALAAIPVILMTTIANVIIATVMGMVTFMQLFWAYGVSRWPSTIVAVLVAIAVHVYIRLQPNIRNYIDRRSHNE
jgi:MFS superfamily sulfate permease-like transporter